MILCFGIENHRLVILFGNFFFFKTKIQSIYCFYFHILTKVVFAIIDAVDSDIKHDNRRQKLATNTVVTAARKNCSGGP